MDDKIFKSQEKVSVSDGMLSFDGCPNRCRHGYYVDPYKHKRVRCDHCFELRKQLVQERVQLSSGTSIAKELRLPESFTGYCNFEFDSLWTKAERDRLEPQSVDFVEQVMKALMERVSLGEPVNSSILLNLGRKAHTQQFIAPFLVRSYISGLTTVPFLSSLDVLRLRRAQSEEMPEGWRAKYWGIKYEDILNYDTCLVYVDAGAGSDKEHELMAVKGLVQLRAWNGKSTIILTDYFSLRMFEIVEDSLMTEVRGVQTNTAMQTADAVRGIVEGGAMSCKDMAVYVSVYYKKGKEGYGVTEPTGGSYNSTLLDPQPRNVGIQ